MEQYTKKANIGALKKERTSKVVHLKNIEEVIYTETNKGSGARVITFEYTLILNYLHKQGFRIYLNELIRIENNIATVVTSELIFKYILEKVKSYDDDLIINTFYKQGESLVLKNKGLLLGLMDVENEPLKDSKDIGFIAYKNGILKVQKTNIELLKYSDISNFVWKEQIIERDFKFIDNYDKDINVYDKCLRNSTNNENHYLNLISAIGNLIHKFKDQRLTKAIIINDENLTERNEEGGSGKGLIVKAINKIRPVLVINGKNADPGKNRFFLQGVTPRTCVISVDDPPRNVVFEDYFSYLTDEMTIEEKHKPSVVIAFKDSPKFCFTTNYTIKGNSSSHKRRRFDVFLNSFYNDIHTPAHDFGHEFFYDWDVGEWNKFDYFMAKCLQTFIKNGLIDYANQELRLKKLKNETSYDFYDLMESDYNNEAKNSLPDLRSKLINCYGDKYNFLNKDTTRLMDWIRLYAEFKGLSLEEGRASYGMWFKFNFNKE